MSELLRLQAVTVELGGARRPALTEVSLALSAGERLALVGANGSGKSTLLRVLLGVQAPVRGEVWRAGGLRAAMVFQHPHLLRASVLTNVALGPWLAGLRWAAACALGRQALLRVGLEALAERPARTLSGGQQQRLALARAWAQQPTLWLLDEPTANLDPRASLEVEALVQTFACEQGAARALVFSSHHLGQVARLATRVLYLHEGRVVVDAPVQAFFDRAWLQAHAPLAVDFVREVLP
ncbi:MAG: ATP-binding cassette domain-containing protein [Tepidimonas sp.]|nr:ATP-binding cassette domain-containing protein [Tepidimonas sp.]